ncbi:MarR family transcriptional regulator [Modestobacter lapidis]|nr:MarR family transcriptional regulator [Modestobacter lapidis]
MSSDASLRPPAGPEDPAVAAVLRLGAQVSEHAMRRKLAPLLATPLTVQQLRCLTILVIEGSATPHHLSDLLAVTPATMTGITDRLVRSGMADRVQDSRDGRGRVVSPTAAGLQVVRELLASDIETDAALLSALAADELAGLRLGLSGILRVLGAGFPD